MFLLMLMTMVASRRKENQIEDLTETFANMCKAQLKLNPEKCVFGVLKDKVLGCLVSMKGIKANPDKINAIVCMKPPQSRKEVQRLTGRNASLNRFMANLAERSLPFFKYSEALQFLVGTITVGSFR
jgi:hypothetical protein